MSQSLVRVLRNALVVAFLAAVTAVLTLETVYRLQVVDTYRAELKSFNPPEALDGGGDRPTILVLGDSFSAGRDGWVSRVREERPGYRVVNGAVSGTGIQQAAIIAPGRIRRFRPSVFLYQIYVGNDLYDVRYPVNRETISPLRNAYWTVSDRVHSLPFLNYRLGQAGVALRNADPDRTVEIVPMRDRVEESREPFSPGKYSPREKLLLLAEPGLIENSALLRGGRERDFRVLRAGLADMLRRLPDGCVPIVVVIPHCAQVTPEYLERMRSIGARFTDAEAVLASTSRFVDELRDFLAAEGPEEVRLLDVLPRLRTAEENGTPVYLPNDPHLNDAGQDLLADVVLEALPPAESRRLTMPAADRASRRGR